MRTSFIRTLWHLLLMACCGLVLFALPGRADEFRQKSHYTRRLFSAATFTMEVRTGDIYITGWDDPHVEIEAEKVVHAGSKEAAEHQYQRLKVLLSGQDEMLQLRTLYPPRRPWRPFRGESDLSVDFRIHMPWDCNLVLKCVDGDVTVRGVAGQEKIVVNYGQVEIDVPFIDRLRSVRAETWLGNIQSDLHGENDAGFSKKVLLYLRRRGRIGPEVPTIHTLVSRASLSNSAPKPGCPAPAARTSV
jgi:hypothetical protein